MRAGRVLCLAIVLAGCLGDGASPAPDERDASADASLAVFAELHAGSCRLHDARFVVPAPLVADDLPANFTAVAPDAAGATAWLGILAVSCDRADAEGISVDGYAELRPYVVVEPPEALGDPRLDEYHLQFWNLVNDPHVMGLYDSWGHWAAHTDVSFAETDVAVGRAGMAAAAEPLWGRWELHTLVDTSMASCDEERTVGVFGTSQDVLVGRVDTTFGPACRADGVAKAVLPDMFMGEPLDAALGMVVNAALTGTGTHLVAEDLQVTQRFVPLPA